MSINIYRKIVTSRLWKFPRNRIDYCGCAMYLYAHFQKKQIRFYFSNPSFVTIKTWHSIYQIMQFASLLLLQNRSLGTVQTILKDWPESGNDRRWHIDRFFSDCEIYHALKIIKAVMSSAFSRSKEFFCIVEIICPESFINNMIFRLVPWATSIVSIDGASKADL